ncbi:GNAT family N-acetyltransferase [Cyanobium sp. ATX 6E8]|uniref:GNAT family N-acetyltransferase n=1 Tax=Cyanobium sp. ATX 6E8 TaxID=2823701 RepID=UPI0020CF90E3|nr:GNAT family N-acetyltransferase [Cyanobium sp. ATX 6E8]MCP9941927.1 GNAT family N-acetyltransferase [Cyanobium sp. ATX 6E8]
MAYALREQPLEAAPWQQLQQLLNACFSRPPRDVFERLVGASHRRQRLWIAAGESGELLGIVMLSPHSKGGHLDNLAVAPQARGQGLGQALVQRLLTDNAATGPAMVSLTTRIPEFFAPLGFQSCGQLADGSTAMLTLLPQAPSRIAH